MPAHPNVRHAHLVRQVALPEARVLAIARDEHRGVSVDLGIDLVIGEVLDLVEARGGFEERTPVELARGPLKRELGSQQLLEPAAVVPLHRPHELVRQLHQLVLNRPDQLGPPIDARSYSGAPTSRSNAYLTTGCFAARTASSVRTGRWCGACRSVSGASAASRAISCIASTNSSSRSFGSVSVGSIISASGTTSGK